MNPYHITFSANGLALVFDREGRRLPTYEGATHADTIALLKFAGFNWELLSRSGVPESYPVRREKL